MARYCLFLGIILVLLSVLSALKVTYDGRSFSLDGNRTLFIAGSVHYPRAARNEWPIILQQAKDSGINLIQTYVFWDIHEPTNNEWNFPSSPSSNEDLVAFVQEAGKLGLYVNLRISGYICAEWNLGGLPVWLRGINGTWRTLNDAWMTELAEFMDKTVAVVRDAGLLANDGGPIVMMQMENEYGNMESYYGEDGHKYVQWAAQYALSMNLDIPWIMCQQGEGVGTAPPAAVINTCNGFYCDNWISQHASDFPNQPHMWTENWPGWFQNWGQPVPHRPSVDVAFAVARWFARGGSYMNYYMAFGGTNFGRTVGGPLIVTSYDYDVHINEYAMRAEPKFSLLSELHRILYDASSLLLDQSVPAAVALTKTCESHTYRSSDPASDSCIQFLSNWGEADSCKFTTAGGAVDVPAWSVSIVSGPNCANVERVFNTKGFVSSAQAANKQVGKDLKVKFAPFRASGEPIPSVSSARVGAVTSPWPLEQLSVTNDATDYLWYSTELPSASARDTAVDVQLSFIAGGAGGAVMFAYLDGELVASSLGEAGGPPIVSMPNKATKASQKKVNSTSTPLEVDFLPVKLKFTWPAGKGNSKLDILSLSMGLQNYGPYLENMKVGIISNITASVSGLDYVLGPFVHTAGLVGEDISTKGSVVPRQGLFTEESSSCSKLCWMQSSFHTPASSSRTAALALDLGSSMGKGSVWVNNRMLGRYWNITATATEAQRSCDQAKCLSSTYVGSYNGDKCRSGCGEPSQRYYKVPAQWLHPANSGLANTIVLFEELGGKPELITLVEITMEAL